MLTVFESAQFGSIRTLTEDGKVLFCGNDVARALGYNNPRDALQKHCKGVVKRDGVSYTTNQYGVISEQHTEMNFNPESDLYRLAFQSKLPGAVRFTDWVTEEVLPSIRRTGGYLPAEAPAVLPEAPHAPPPDDNSLSGIVASAVRTTLTEVMPYVRGRRKPTTPAPRREELFVGLRVNRETLEQFDRVCMEKGITRTELMKEGMRRMIYESEKK